ncbi:putative B3 domain-containing protein At4g03170 [Raphanus sativus]|uniref:B3 domain-containing protein At4g03170 n=1 Tax=Raphanus sativus TaxID=3726 RepID=A0A9W3BZ52_RAPSA|nr:putative B3 domain-containing protein At4g03170 [Raphanus sativus]
MASSTQDEQVHHRMEEDALDDEDLNNEQKVEPEVKVADDNKIVASESATSEQEVKDANQEDESRGGTMTTTSPPRSLTQEEEEELREKEARASAILLSMYYDAVPPKNPSVLEIDDHEKDDSEQTLRFLTRWKAPDLPPNKIIHHLIEQCSRPIQKQLTTSDVNSRKLSLPRKKFQQLLDETEAARGRKETRVSVYGPDGKVHEMWVGDKERSSFELTLGWRKFVVDYGLKECCDFITVWMFRRRDTQGICLAVDAIRFSFRKEVSKRISQAAFEDDD